MKLRWNRWKHCAFFLAGVMMAGLCSPVTSVSAEALPALRMGTTHVDPASLGDDRIVTVTLSFDAYDTGFLAAEFGLLYDSRLTVADVRAQEAAADFTSYLSAEHNMLWFSGARAATDAPFLTEESAALYQIDFQLPEELTLGDTYYIDYCWNGLDGAPSFWYTGREQNILDTLKAESVPGVISLSNAESPQLDYSELTLNQGETFSLTAQHVTGAGVWFSDNPTVAGVDSNGMVTAYAPGECEISAFFAESEVLLSCIVTVRSDYHYSIADTDPILITSREQMVTLEFPDAVGTTKWLTTNPNVVTVADGVLTPVENGTAQIIATNNGVSKSRVVIVQFPEEPTQPTTEPVTETEPPTETEPFTDVPPLESGDLNGDASIDIADVITVNRFLLGSASLSASQRTAADVFHDTVLDSTDALTLLKFVVEMIPELPLEP